MAELAAKETQISKPGPNTLKYQEFGIFPAFSLQPHRRPGGTAQRGCHRAQRPGSSLALEGTRRFSIVIPASSERRLCSPKSWTRLGWLVAFPRNICCAKRTVIWADQNATVRTLSATVTKARPFLTSTDKCNEVWNWMSLTRAHSTGFRTDNVTICTETPTFFYSG